MSDIVDGGAAAPAEASSAPIEQPASPPQPIRTEGEPAPKADPKPDAAATKPLTTREALTKAREAIEKREAGKPTEKGAEKPVDKAGDKAAPIKDGPNRGEGGKFAPKEGAQPVEKPNTAQAQPAAEKLVADLARPAQRYEAPARFSAEAKDAWEAAPDPVKAETHRAIREIEQGFKKHREAATNFELVRKYHDMAKESGTTLDQALDRYVSLENLARQDPIRGLEAVCENLGLSLRDVAAHVMGQSPEQNASQQDATIRELRGTIQQLQQQVGSVTGHISGQQQQATARQIEEFATANPRFDELSDTIAMLLSKGVANDLSEAYSMADRLNPATSTASTPVPPAPKADLTAQTLKGAKSISGAPSTGSDPAATKTSSPTIKEALKRAFAQAG